MTQERYCFWWLDVQLGDIGGLRTGEFRTLLVSTIIIYSMLSLFTTHLISITSHFIQSIAIESIDYNKAHQQHQKLSLLLASMIAGFLRKRRRGEEEKRRRGEEEKRRREGEKTFNSYISWYPAVVPYNGTVMAVLLQNNVYENITQKYYFLFYFFAIPFLFLFLSLLLFVPIYHSYVLLVTLLYSVNLLNVNSNQFKTPWWYRTEFTVPDAPLVTVTFKGINYKVSIYYNHILVFWWEQNK